MDWEIYEPDPKDEFFDLLCRAMYSAACNERRDVYADTEADVSYPVAG